MNKNSNSSWKSLPGPLDITRSVLPNGIILLTRSNYNSPSVVVSGYLPSGSIFDPREKLGLAHFTALALMRGTQKHTFQQIYDALESVGASLGFGASVHNTSFGGRALAEDLPLLLNTLSEAIREPGFPAEHIERLRAQLLTGLAMRDQDTADRASIRFDEVVFADHPYGLPEDGYPETIQAIRREDILSHHQRIYGPRNMVLVVVGAVSASQVYDYASQAFGEWENPLQPAAPELPVLAPLTVPVREHIPLPGKSQTDLVMGGFGPKRSSPDYLAASLGNNILGQFGMMGRIGDVVREQAGLAYYASTSLNSWIHTGSWEVSAGVNPANLQRAIDLILVEINRFISEPVSLEELQDSQANYIGRLPLSMESNNGVAAALLNLERFQLGLDYYQQFPVLVAAITPEDVLQAAQRYLFPDRMVAISSGPELQS
ncbi:predicted Zn-dependent peptidase [Longilinea arvoryzae]|uniref:Predicted Zn-dependent peptidase n=1 Tax=Longilinea arvoryzae TaxID=360412 RepID=A0A0S7BMD6_9CHLR|nr:pitrilysin family protein [Longilinea arvoryzae]GAP15416.1 predicted Zn-dependent peptidase [Longilinea arvoryzae]